MPVNITNIDDPTPIDGNDLIIVVKADPTNTLTPDEYGSQQSINDMRVFYSPNANEITLSELAPEVRAEIRAQHSMFAAWGGLVDPLSEMPPWMSNVTGKYDAGNHVWPIIGSAGSPPSNDRNNQLYMDNDEVDWDSVFAFRWSLDFTHVPSASNSTGSVQVFWGGNAFTSTPGWLGHLTQGLGLWTTRVRTATGIDSEYDNWMFVALRAQNSGIGGSPAVVANGFLRNDSGVILHNGALRPQTGTRLIGGSTFSNAQIGIFIPQTNEKLSFLIQGLNNQLFLRVNEIHYATFNLTGLTGLTYGPRFGWLGDNGGANGNKALLSLALVGVDAPLDSVPRKIDGGQIIDGTIAEAALGFDISGDETEVTDYTGYISFADFDAEAVFTDTTNGRAIDGASTVVTGLTPTIDDDGNYSMAFAILPNITLTDIQLDGVSVFSNFAKQSNELSIEGRSYAIYAWDPWDANPRVGNGTWTLEGHILGEVIPSGGTANQYLAKNSDADYDLAYVDLPISSATQSGIITPSQYAKLSDAVIANEELTAIASLPATADYSVGDLINLEGVLYELVDESEDQNVYRGTIAQRTGNFIGDDVFEFEPANPNPAAEARNLFIPKTAPGFATTQPASITTILRTPTTAEYPGGVYLNIGWARNSGGDTVAAYAYQMPSGGESLSAIELGTPFSLSFYSDEAATMPLNYWAADRWERDDRNQAHVNPIAIAGNEESWPKTKLPSDIGYGVNPIALDGNTDVWPASKLPPLGSNITELLWDGMGGVSPAVSPNTASSAGGGAYSAVDERWDFDNNSILWWADSDIDWECFTMAQTIEITNPDRIAANSLTFVMGTSKPMRDNVGGVFASGGLTDGHALIINRDHQFGGWHVHYAWDAAGVTTAKAGLRPLPGSGAEVLSGVLQNLDMITTDKMTFVVTRIGRLVRIWIGGVDGTIETADLTLPASGVNATPGPNFGWRAVQATNMTQQLYAIGIGEGDILHRNHDWHTAELRDKPVDPGIYGYRIQEATNDDTATNFYSTHANWTAIASPILWETNFSTGWSNVNSANTSQQRDFVLPQAILNALDAGAILDIDVTYFGQPVPAGGQTQSTILFALRRRGGSGGVITPNVTQTLAAAGQVSMSGRLDDSGAQIRLLIRDADDTSLTDDDAPFQITDVQVRVHGTLDVAEFAREDNVAPIPYNKQGAIRGALLATSSVLPTAVQPSNNTIGNTWSLNTGSWLTTSTNELLAPRIRSGYPRGVWIVVRTPNDLSEVFLPYGIFQSTPMWLGIGMQINVSWNINIGNARSSIALLGGGTAIPANTTVRVYEG